MRVNIANDGALFLFQYSAGPLILGYYAKGMHAIFFNDLNTAYDGASAKVSPFHALIVLGENDCPYWHSCMTNLSKFHIVFSIVPLYASTRMP